MRDLRSDIMSKVLIATEALAADNTPAAVDILGFDSAVVQINVGVGGITFSTTNKVEFKLTHCDTSGGTYTAVTDADVDLTESNITAVGTGGIVRSLIAAHAAATAVNIGYIGGKRYLKLLADFDGTHGTATPMGANVIVGRPHSGPTS